MESDDLSEFIVPRYTAFCRSLIKYEGQKTHCRQDVLVEQRYLREAKKSKPAIVE